MDLKSAGNLLYLIGELKIENVIVPDVPRSTPQIYRAFHQAITRGLVKSAHDLNEGGLAVAAAEMCIGGRLGLNIVAASVPPFAEVNGCLLAEVSPIEFPAFEQQFAGLPFIRIGEVTTYPALKIAGVEIPIEELVKAFNAHS